MAPTAANLQPIHLIAVQSEKRPTKISKAAGIYDAPLAIIVCADHDKAWMRYFKPDVLSREFDLPASLEPVNILVIGYAAEDSTGPERHSQTRISVNELVSYEKL